MLWIECKKKLPEKYTPVLVCAAKFNEEYARKDSLIFVATLFGRMDAEWQCVWGDGWHPFSFESITHWAELPENPNLNKKLHKCGSLFENTERSLNCYEDEDGFLNMKNENPNYIWPVDFCPFCGYKGKKTTQIKAD